MKLPHYNYINSKEQLDLTAEKVLASSCKPISPLVV